MANARRKSAEASQDVFGRVRKAWGEGPIYQAALRGPAPDRIVFTPGDPRTPDKEIAAALLRGKLAFGDEAIDCESELERLWDLAAPGSHAFRFLHEFGWLAHLNAAGDEGKTVARRLTAAWLDRYERWSAEAWSPELTAERLVAMCCYNPIVINRTDVMWRSRVLSSMARQTRHLARAAHRAETGYGRLMAAIGLAIVGYCLPGCEAPAERGLEMTRREVRLQLRPDGGHVSRNPSRQLRLALRLQMLLRAIEARGGAAPGFLRHVVARASGMAAFFRCGDGKLAVFNGGYEDDPRALVRVQETIDNDLVVADFARHSGYHRLTAARATLIIDTGDDSAALHRFKSAGSLHFSSGRSRILVNCGNGAHRGGEWEAALCGPAAHSAVSFDQPASSLQFGPVAHRRAEDSKGQLVEFERSLLAARTDNAMWLRRLFIAANGADLRGEELIDNLPRHMIETAAFRFHLHPGVRASLARDRKSVVLLLPNKEGWRFKSNCPALSLEKTVYCGHGGAPMASQQIVIEAALAPTLEATKTGVKWALQRLDAV